MTLVSKQVMRMKLKEKGSEIPKFVGSSPATNIKQRSYGYSPVLQHLPMIMVYLMVK